MTETIIIDEPVHLPSGFFARPAELADAQVVTDLLNAYSLVVFGTTRFSLDECLQEWSTPGFDLASSSLLVFSEDGTPVAYMEIWDESSPPVSVDLFGGVSPDWWGRGLGTAILNWGFHTAQRALQRVPDGVQVEATCHTPLDHWPTVALFDALGLEHTRTFYRMVLELTDPPPAPSWPSGLRLVTLAEFDDLAAVYQAVRDTFQDHRGFVERPFEEGLQQFRHQLNEPDFDPSLWFLLLDESDQIAALALCFPKADEDPDKGYIGTLGVQRAWRKRGLGLNLLYHAFAVYWQRERYRQVVLSVDAHSLTGATRLYEKAGMIVDREVAVYRRILRPGRVLSVEQLDEITNEIDTHNSTNEE